MSDFKFQMPCPCPARREGCFSVYEDGTATCFSANCEKRKDDKRAFFSKEEVGKIMGEQPAKAQKLVEFLELPINGLKARGISKETCEFFDYQSGKVEYPDGTEEFAHVANWWDETGEHRIGQKIRYEGKKFKVNGKINDLYGKWLWNRGKFIVITEGEIDALSFAEATKCKYPVVSVPNGVDSAKGVLQNNLRWLEENFEQIVLAFDNDDVGKKAALQCATLFAPHKCLIYTPDEKDLNEELIAGNKQKLSYIPFRAVPYRPAHIVYIDDLAEAINKPIPPGIDTPWEGLTKLINGVRLHEVHVIGAGTGCGKTEIIKEFMTHFRKMGKRVGGILLEENPIRTFKSLIGKVTNTPFHLDNTCLTPKQIEEAKLILRGEDGKALSLYDGFGQNSVEEIKKQMYWMINADQCEYIFLDHITSLSYSDASKGMTENLDMIMQDIAKMTREKPVTLFIITHLRKKSTSATRGSGRSHESGGDVSLDDFRGSGAIKQWASFAYGLHRNIRESDPSLRNQVRLTILKDRETGQAAGQELFFKYDPKSARIVENTSGSAYGFQPYEGNSSEEEEIEFGND